MPGSRSPDIVWMLGDRMMARAPMTPSLHEGSTLDAHLGNARIPLAIGDRAKGVEHLWSPAGATSGNWWQMGHHQKRLK
jgi:hypothetical protein